MRNFLFFRRRRLLNFARRAATLRDKKKENHLTHLHRCIPAYKKFVKVESGWMFCERWYIIDRDVYIISYWKSEKMSSKDMLILKKAYDFSKWLLHHTGKFPKSYRFSVAVKLENRVLDFIELTTTANMRRDKLPLLKRADESLAQLKIIFRLSYDMRFITIKSYEFGSRQMDELGRLLGSWIKVSMPK